jgi:UDP-glucose 6-dehydrogenase
MAQIGVFGSGTVGVAVGKGLQEMGNEVMFYDIERSRVRLLRRTGINITTHVELVILNLDFLFICVPTPNKNGTADLSAVMETVTSICNNLRRTKCYKVLVIKSTVVPISTENHRTHCREDYWSRF